MRIVDLLIEHQDFIYGLLAGFIPSVVATITPKPLEHCKSWNEKLYYVAYKILSYVAMNIGKAKNEQDRK